MAEKKTPKFSLVPGDLPQLSKTESQWREGFLYLFANHTVPMWILCEKSQQVAGVNQAALDLYGYSREGFLDLSVHDLITTQEPRRFQSDTSLHRRSDGGLFPVRYTMQPLVFQRQPSILVSVTDISAERDAEAACEEANRKYRAIFENAVEGFFQLRTDGGVIEVNPAFARMLGYRSPRQLCERLAGAGNGFFATSQDRDRFEVEMRECGIVKGREVLARRRDGQLLWMSLHCRTVRNREGALLCFEGTAEDITERKANTERLHRANMMLARNMEALSQSNRELQQFAYAVSHDLQEPLRMISGYVTLLAMRYKGKLGEEADEFIGYAVDGAKRMKTLIEDLLEFCSLSQAQQPHVAVDTRSVVEGVAANLSHRIAEKGAKLEWGELPFVRGIRVQLAQLFQNLISNALKFNDAPDPRVVLRAEELGESWLFSCSDNGIGIPVEHYDRVFQIFQRLHSREQYPGTGVGLALCKKIVESHGGRIWIESKPGQGATFFFTLPRADDALATRCPEH